MEWTKPNYNEGMARQNLIQKSNRNAFSISIFFRENALVLLRSKH